MEFLVLWFARWSVGSLPLGPSLVPAQRQGMDCQEYIYIYIYIIYVHTYIYIVAVVLPYSS